MTIWVDAQLSPAIAFWIESNFDVIAFALRDLGLRDAEDEEIFNAAEKADACNDKRQRFCFTPRQIRRTTENYLADLRQYFKR